MNNLHINDTMTEIDVFDDNELKTFNSKEDVSLNLLLKIVNELRTLNEAVEEIKIWASNYNP